jgi:hypothetical protein
MDIYPMVMDTEYMTMIMKDDKSWVILSWTLVLNSVLSVFFIKS